MRVRRNPSATNWVMKINLVFSKLDTVLTKRFLYRMTLIAEANKLIQIISMENILITVICQGKGSLSRDSAKPGRSDTGSIRYVAGNESPKIEVQKAQSQAGCFRFKREPVNKQV